MVIQADVAVRHVLEHLRKNRLVTILADRDFGNHGIMMDFFGRKTMIPKGAAFFSMKTGAPIIPGFFFHTDDDHFEINVYPPLEPPHLPDGKITEEAAREYIQKYLTIIEDEIRKKPSQWLLFREFWKS
jgi:KDO2-lipid IV(A) lauroyltransferase